MLKRKFIACSVLGMLILMNIATVLTIADEDSGLKQSTMTSTGKEWTLMFYGDADYNDSYDPLEDFSEQAFSGDNLNVIFLQDRYDGPAALWYIDENHSKILLREMGEVNMGNYTTLRDFINYGKNNFSAQRYILFINDHGGGWLGCCMDSTPNGWLTMYDLKKALTEAGGVDVTCFVACHMAAVESAYELRNCTKIYIGSEEGSGYGYWMQGSIRNICKLIDNNRDISNIDLGKNIINILNGNLFSTFFNKIDYKYYAKDVTMSAIDTSKMENVASSIDQLAKSLADKLTGSVAKINRNHFRIKLIRNLTQSFPPKFDLLRSKKDKFDIYDFSKKCYHFFFLDKEIRCSAKKVMKSINEAVIANLKGISHLRAHGLTIYFPPDFDSPIGLYKLDFVNNTYWDEFLGYYLCSIS